MCVVTFTEYEINRILMQQRKRCSWSSECVDEGEAGMRVRPTDGTVRSCVRREMERNESGGSWMVS